ncbi:hypothetical protein WR25_12482 [Diploscapter pachys]|uniref:SSD domain-containing protein n=1 Tax=Diploscapter pachys TaxID=2018661 RepID=A0A2A2KDA9_9BILA|nr:hypothetical protein WR25_12482 [Diploscapter pachys]
MCEAFDHTIHSVFFRIGLIIHKFRLAFFVASTLFTIVSGLGLLWINEQTTRDPQFVFSPKNAPWRYERAVLAQHWPLDEQKFWPGKSYDLSGYIDVIVAGKQHPDYGRPNILSQQYLEEVMRINDFIVHNLTVPVDLHGKHYEIAYTDLCMTNQWACYLNDHLFMLMPKSKWGNFSGPIAEIAAEIINTQARIFGNSVVQNASVDLLDFGVTHNESLPEGLQDVADALSPKFAGTCTILFTFCIAVSVVLMNHGHGFIAIDWVRSKPLVACAGILCPLFAIVTSFGLILWTGEYYNAIVNVSPFLVICIGIDDLFVMSAEWHRTNPECSPAQRVAATLSHAAVAITVTSITDIVTFAIGCFTTLPGVRMFCLYTCVQCVFTYVYQITLFSPVLAWAAEMEAKGIHSMLFIKATESNDTEKVNKGWKQKLNRAVRKLETKLEHGEKEKHKDELDHEETLVNKLFREIIGPFILDKTTQLCALLLYIIFMTLSVIGILSIKEGLDPKLLVRESFYLSKFYALIDETFWQEGLQLQIVVNNPPDFFNPKIRETFEQMLDDFQNTKYTMNGNATMLWLKPFEKYLEKEKRELNIEMPKNSSEWNHRCRDWLLIADGRRLWEMDMKWGGTQEDYYELKAFRFQIGLRNYRTPTDHTNSCKLIREICDKYRQFNVTSFHEYYPFADQYLELKPSLYQNFVLGVFSMLAVTMVMIPDWRCACSVVLSIVSINIGVLGFMAYWGVNLDSVSMITVIMCIGFAVDLSAHIAYAFSQAYGSAHHRAVEALETLGWPMFLSASSTLLGILVLTLVDAYIVQIFFKTVFLVIAFSMLHGLLFLPIFLIWIMPRQRVKPTEKGAQPMCPLDNNHSFAQSRSSN